MSNRIESRIPVGTQFSPSLINLPAFIQMAIKNSGNVQALLGNVIHPPVRIKPYSNPPTRRMRMLPLEASVQYGLLSENSYIASDLAHKLCDLDEKKMYEAFARHILLNLGGLRVVEAIQQMSLDGLSITGDTLATYLSDQGFRVTVHNTAINTMRMWLAKTGLFPENGRRQGAWHPDPEIKEKLVGMNDDQIAILAGFSPEQIAFAKALCLLAPPDQIAASDVRDHAESIYGVRFGRASLPNEILIPLQKARLIQFETGGTRSGKTSRLRLTDGFRSDILRPFLTTTLDTLNTALTAYYRQRPENIYQGLDSDDRYTRGYALEAFAIYAMRLLGLRFLGWRRRARDTGYSEVDALLAGLLGAIPTTWQVQCKNTPRSSIRLEDVAKEVGLLPLTHATHIMVFANSDFTRDARKFAQEIMHQSSVTIFLLDRQDFEDIKANPANIGRILKKQSELIQDRLLTDPLWSGIERPDQNTSAS